MNRFAMTCSVLFAVASIAIAQEMPGMPGMRPATLPASQPGAVDVGNTICPVSNDKVETSKLTEIYEGKIYHLCCSDCPPQFKADPARFAKAVADDPAKFGVKKDK